MVGSAHCYRGHEGEEQQLGRSCLLLIARSGTRVACGPAGARTHMRVDATHLPGNCKCNRKQGTAWARLGGRRAGVNGNLNNAVAISELSTPETRDHKPWWLEVYRRRCSSVHYPKHGHMHGRKAVCRGGRCSGHRSSGATRRLCESWRSIGRVGRVHEDWWLEGAGVGGVCAGCGAMRGAWPLGPGGR